MLVRVASAALLLFTVACGGSPMSPTGPSEAGGPAAITGATIRGQVTSGPALTPMMAATANSAAAGLTVTVVGTSISATVNGTGQFTLTGVPAGSTQLNFAGPGVNVTINISPVQGTETVSITVKISGNQAEIESEGHENHGDAELHGIVSALAGTQASFNFMLGTMKVRGDSQTSFFGDGNRTDTFSRLRNGARVEVKGTTGTESVYAQRIHINGGNSGTDDDDDDDADDDDDDADDDDDDDDDADEDDDEAEVTGTLSGLTSGCGAFSVSGTSVTTNGRTEFKPSCSALRNGDRVKVEGARQSNGSILASEVKRM